MKSKYKVGDSVKVKDDLVTGKIYGSDAFINDMRKHLGKVVIIEEVTNRGRYKINGCSYNFTDEMLDSEKYSEKQLPRKMQVWNTPIQKDIEIAAVVLYIHKNGQCVAYNKATKSLFIWDHCKDIKEEESIELTIDQIAKKFGVNPKYIKIKK